jgi:hypothetical protein
MRVRLADADFDVDNALPDRRVPDVRVPGTDLLERVQQVAVAGTARLIELGTP